MSRPQPEGVVVLGAPRSGTTLVRRLLDAHPDICCPPETNLLVAAARFLSEDQTAGGVKVGVLSGLGFSGVPAQEVLNRLRELVFGFLREIADIAGCPVWAEKTAFASFYIGAVRQLCGGHVQYLCVVRDPLDCVSSQKELTDKMEVFLPEFHALIRRHRSPYRGLAEGWSEVNRGILDLARELPERSLLIRYEDLVAEPGDTLERIFAFLQRPAQVEEVLATAFRSSPDVGLGDWKTYLAKEVHQSSVGRWRRLSFETLRAIVPIVSEVATEMSYQLIDVGTELDEDEARHRFQLSLMAAQMRANLPPADGGEGKVE